MLVSAGLTVGSFVSPYMVEPRDSIWLNNLPVARLEYDKARQHVNAAATANSDFEELTVTALWLFEQSHVDVAVVEAGLGIAWDATMVIPENVIAASVITSIGEDHVPLLGRNEIEIARSKACIARRGRPLIVSRAIPRSLLDEIANTIKPLQCPLILSPSIHLSQGGAFSVFGIHIPSLKMRGEHQLSNFAVAAATVLNVLGYLGKSINRPSLLSLRAEDVLITPAKTVRVTGRMERVPWPCLHKRTKKSNPKAFLKRFSSRTVSALSVGTTYTRGSKSGSLIRRRSMPDGIGSRSFYVDPPGIPSVNRERVVWLDGAHNLDGLKAISSWLESVDYVIVGFTSHSKNESQLLAMLKQLSICKRVCFTSFPPPDELPGVRVYDPLHCCKLFSSIADDPTNVVGAFQDLMAVFEEIEGMQYHHKENKVEILVTGSLYLIADYHKQFYGG